MSAKKEAPAKDYSEFVALVKAARGVLPPPEPGDNNPTSLAARLLDEALAKL